MPSTQHARIEGSNCPLMKSGQRQYKQESNWVRHATQSMFSLESLVRPRVCTARPKPLHPVRRHLSPVFEPPLSLSAGTIFQSHLCGTYIEWTKAQRLVSLKSNSLNLLIILSFKAEARRKQISSSWKGVLLVPIDLSFFFGRSMRKILCECCESYSKVSRGVTNIFHQATLAPIMGSKICCRYYDAKVVTVKQKHQLRVHARHHWLDWRKAQAEVRHAGDISKVFIFLRIRQHI